MESDPHQPHDKLFKAGFSDPVNAAAFLREHIPAGLSAQSDWERMRLEPGSFVDSQFRASESDLLFSVPIQNRESFIYLLFEHQRVFDRWIGLRLLRYMVRIWEGVLQGNSAQNKLPLIVPVVLAQNAKSWEMQPQFATLLDVPEGSEDFVPDFTFRLIQLAEMPFAKIHGTPAGILVLRALKAEQTGDMLGEEVWDNELISNAPHIFETILRYILAASDIDKSGFVDRVKKIQDVQLQKTAMTLAQQFRQEGHQEGRQEGQVFARQMAIIDVLKIRFEGIPEGLVEKIYEIADPSRLQALHRSAVICPSLEDFSSAL